MEKYRRAGKATYSNIARAHCVLDT